VRLWWWCWWRRWDDKGRFRTTARPVCVSDHYIYYYFRYYYYYTRTYRLEAFVCCVFENDRGYSGTHTVHTYYYYIHITYTRVVFDGLRRCRFSPSRFIDPLSSSSSQQYIIIICDASAQRTWLARAFPKYPRGSQNPFLFTIVSILLLSCIKK